MSKKLVAQKYDVPKNTISTWVKNKDILLTLLEKNGTKSKQKKICTGNFENVDKAIFMWFVMKESISTNQWYHTGRKSTKIRRSIGRVGV